MNLLGLPFEKYVTDQINLRQQVFGNANSSNSGYFPTQNLQYINNRAPWIRLASSVSLEPGDQPDKFPRANEANSVINKLKTLGVDNNDLQGSRLAKRFLLQGGALSAYTGEVPAQTPGYTVPAEGNFTGLSSGIVNSKSSDVFKVAYGWGGVSDKKEDNTDADGNRRGFVPMPGITSATVTYYNNGAFAKGTINIQCFSRLQMALIETLYMHPGYTLLLEWGWSQYLDNETKLPKPFDSFLTEPLSTVLNSYKKPHFEIYNQIKNEREKHSGNYDAMFGTISKFKWSLQPNMSYMCEVQISGYGDMMESLTINRALAQSSFEDASGTDNIAKVQETGLSILGPDVKPEDRPDGALFLNATKTELNRALFNYSVYLQSGFFADQGTKILAVGKGSGGIFNFPQAEFKDIPIKNFIDKDSEFKIKDLTIKAGGMTVKDVSYENSEVENSQYTLAPTPACYITFGTLLAIIQSTTLIYNKEGESTIPLFTFDMDFKNLNNDDNYMYYHNGMYSGNPKICLIPYENPTITKTEKNRYVDDKGSGIFSKIFATINKDIAGSYADTILNKGLTDAGAKFKTDDPYVARMANIYINTNYLAKALADTPATDEGGISLLRYLKQVLTDVSVALGSVNQFTIRHDKDSGLIRFYDDIPQRNEKTLGEDTTDSFARFEFTTKPDTAGSFVRSLNVNSELNDKYGTAIAIGAAASQNTTATNGFSFADYNKGMLDRHAKKREDFTPPKNVTPPPPPDYLLLYMAQNKIRDVHKQVYEEGEWDDQVVATLTSLNVGQQKLVKNALVSEGQVPAPQLLPFNLSMDVDGIGGIKLFEKFVFDDKILPPSYGNDNCDLLVKSINHNIDTTGWVTKIETIFAPKNPLSPFLRPPVLTSSTTTQQGTGGGGGGGVPGKGGASAPLPGPKPPADEKLRIKVTRFMDDGTQTLGVMSILAEDEKTVLFSVALSELPWKNNANNISCIPTDLYRVKSHRTEKHGQCYWVIGGERSGFAFNKLFYNGYTRGAVLIHRAPKAPGWLQGCLAPGPFFNTSGTPPQSGKQKGTGTEYLNPSKKQSIATMAKINNILWGEGSFQMRVENVSIGGTKVPLGKLKERSSDFNAPLVQNFLKKRYPQLIN